VMESHPLSRHFELMGFDFPILTRSSRQRKYAPCTPTSIPTLLRR
jgi:hypothetical protein